MDLIDLRIVQPKILGRSDDLVGAASYRIPELPVVLQDT